MKEPMIIINNQNSVNAVNNVTITTSLTEKPIFDIQSSSNGFEYTGTSVFLVLMLFAFIGARVFFAYKENQEYKRLTTLLPNKEAESKLALMRFSSSI